MGYRNRLEIFVSAFVVATVVMALWPFSYWYRVGQVQIDDVNMGEEIIIRYDGGSTRSFIGSYAVIMRDTTTYGVVCDATGGPFPYSTKSQRPHPLTMGWWAPSDERCARPPAGEYTLETCWTVSRPFGIFPDKTRCVTSNVFLVTQ